MMKMRRILCIAIVLALTLCISAYAFAAGPIIDVGDGIEGDFGIHTEVDNNIADFRDPTPLRYRVKFETNEAVGTLDGEKEIYVRHNSIIPEEKVPEFVPNPGEKPIGWIVKGEEEKGIIDLEKFRVKKDITLIAVYEGYSYIELLNKEDHFAYMNGDTGGTFRPDDSMNRAEAATVFYNLLLNKEVPLTKEFSDVPDDVWFAKAVKTLASLNIINGYEDGTFKPMKTISRAEFAAIATRFGQLSKGNAKFKDVSSKHWAYKYIMSAASNGWVEGYPDGTFKPEAEITRGAAAKIINGVLGRKADVKYIDSHDVKEFSDLSTEHWAYYNIMEAVNSHKYIITADKEIWTSLK